MLTVEVVGNSAAEMPGFVDRAIGGRWLRQATRNATDGITLIYALVGSGSTWGYSTSNDWSVLPFKGI
ncbi:hypothetical protein FOXYSP1_19556 [Fusarium oxysporum f. sp. phaseoli]